MSTEKKPVKLCKRGLHDLNDPKTLIYVQPSNQTRQCLVCHREQVKEYRSKPKGPCKKCGSTNRERNGTCRDCSARRKAARELAADDFL